MLGIIPYLYGRSSRLLNAPARLHEANGTKLTRIQIGDLGENIASARLRADGRKILYRNYRGPKGGEVDIIARDGAVLSFIEVKTRTSKGYGRPLDAVDASKEVLIERGANAWLRMLNSRKIAWRFDVVEVILTEGEIPSIHLVNNAF